MKTATRAEEIVSLLWEKKVYVQQAAEPQYVRAVFHRSVQYSNFEHSLNVFKLFVK